MKRQLLGAFLTLAVAMSCCGVAGADELVAEDGDDSQPIAEVVEEPQLDSYTYASVSKATYKISWTAKSGRVIGVKSNSVMSGAAAVCTKSSSASTQNWTIKSADSNSFYIVNAKSGKALTASSGAAVGTTVVQKALKKIASQKWIIRKVGSAYAISPKSNSTACLAASACDGSAKAALRIAKWENTPSQLFKLAKTSYKMTKSSLIKSLNSASSSKSVTAFGGAAFDKKSKAGKRVAKALKALKKSSGTIGFIMIDLETGAGIASSSTKEVYGASTIKGPYVTAICKYNPKSIDYSARDHIDEVCDWSSNEDYTSLRSRFGGTPMSKFMKYCGVNEISAWSTWVHYSPKTLAKFWTGTYWYMFQDTGSKSSYLKRQHKKGAESFIRRALSSKATTYTKAGWGPFDRLGDIYNDAGIVSHDGHKYVVVVMSKAYFHPSQLRELVKAIDDYYLYMRK